MSYPRNQLTYAFTIATAQAGKAYFSPEDAVSADYACDQYGNQLVTTLSPDFDICEKHVSIIRDDEIIDIGLVTWNAQEKRDLFFRGLKNIYSRDADNTDLQPSLEASCFQAGDKIQIGIGPALK